MLRLVLVVLVFLAWASPGLAQEVSDRALEEGRVTHLGPGPWDDLFRPYDDFQEAARAAGLDLQATYSVIAQRGSQAGPDNRLVNQTVDLYSFWQATERGGLGAYGFYGEELLGGSARDFALAQGSRLLPNDDTGAPFTSLLALWWQQEGMLDGALDLHVGHLAPVLLFDVNTYANWDRESFLSQPLAGNPTRVAPQCGLGVHARVHPSDSWSLSASLMDGEGTDRGPDMQALGAGGFARLAELAWTPEGGAYRLSWQSVDASHLGPESQAWLLSAEQEVGEDAALFARYGTNDGRRTDLRQSASGGVVFTGPFGFTDDWLGLGGTWGRPSDPALPDEVGLEAYWRLQLSERIQFTPDLQVLLRPETQVTGGVRLTLIL